MNYQGTQKSLYQMILAEMLIRYQAADDGKPEVLIFTLSEFLNAELD